jgi:hypothetical protein
MIDVEHCKASKHGSSNRGGWTLPSVSGKRRGLISSSGLELARYASRSSEGIAHQPGPGFLWIIQ